jgi:hypothetical protein
MPMSSKVLEPGFVIVAVHHPKRDLLVRQIRSIADQTVREFRCLIGIDGADPDVTAFLSGIVGSDPRFEIREYADNLGIYRHMERLLAAVPRDVAWVALADQDDYFYPDKFAVLADVLATDGTTAVIGQARVTTAEGAVLSTTRRRAGSIDDLILLNQMTGGASMFRREVLDFATPFPPPSRRAVHDHWLAAVAAGVGAVVTTSAVVQDYVQHGDNLIGEQGNDEFRRRMSSAPRLGIRRWLEAELGSVWEWRRAVSTQLQMNLGVERTGSSRLGPQSSNASKLRAIGSSVRSGHLRVAEGSALVVAAGVARLLRRSA